MAFKTLMFLGGLLGVVHETLVMRIERPLLLGVFTAMMGLPSMLSVGRRRQDDERSDR